MNNDCPLAAKASFSTKISREDVDGFARLSGDGNPLHCDDGFAAGTRFGRRVVHGMFLASLFSRMVGMHLGRKDVLYVSQTLEFRNPAFIGDEVTVEFSLESWSQAAGLATYRSTITNAAGKLLVDGKTKVMLL